MMNEKQIKEKIFLLKKEIAIYEEVLNSQSEGIGRPSGSYEYTEEQVRFLKKNKEMPMRDLIPFFNRAFETDYPEDDRTLYKFMDRQGIINPVRRSSPIMEVNKKEVNKKKRGYEHSKKYVKRKAPKGLTKYGIPRKRNFTPRGILTYSTNRDEAVALNKLSIFGSKTEKDAYAKKFNKTWNEILKSISNIRKKHKITPQEVGVKEFRKKSGNMKNNFKVEELKKEEVKSEEVKYY